VLAKRNWTAGNGGSTLKPASCEVLPGDTEVTMTDMSRDTSEREKSPKSLQDIKKHMKDGEEPVEVLLGLASSPIIDLQQRGLAKVLSAEKAGRKIVVVIFYDTEWVDGKGIMVSK
jgi:hypothetical protein